MPLPPVTSRVCPETYDDSGDARLQNNVQHEDLLVEVEQGTYNNIAPAASSAVAPRPRGIVANNELGSGALAGAGIPRATFLPSISIVSPSCLAAVKLNYEIK